MTYLELKQAVVGYIHRSDLEAEMNLFSILVEDELNQRLRAQEMVVNFPVDFSVPMPVPINYLEMDGLYVNTANGRSILESVSVDQLNQFNGSTSILAYALVGSNIDFNAYTDQTGEMVYWARVSPVATVNETAVHTT